jgi:hypothetical protein
MRPATPSPTLPLSGGGSAPNQRLKENLVALRALPMRPPYSSKISFTETTDSVPAPPALLTPDTA